jgi:serine/threonine protein kinase
VKPANIVCCKVSPLLEVKLTDLGIVRRVDGARSVTHATADGIAVGSPYYMSPEHVELGKVVGRSSDLWSLAVTAYEALVGELPFKGASLAAVAAAIRHDQPASPSAIVPELPTALDAFFERAFALDPGARFASGAAMSDALEVALAPALSKATLRMRAQTPVPEQPRRGSRLAMAAPVALLAAIAVFVWAVRGAPPPATPVSSPAVLDASAGVATADRSDEAPTPPPPTVRPASAAPTAVAPPGLEPPAPARSTSAPASRPAPAEAPPAAPKRRPVDPSEIF